MSDNKTFLPLGAAAQADNEEGSHYDYLRHGQVDKPVSTRISAAEIRAYGLVAGGGLLLVLLILWFFKTTTCWRLNEFTMTTNCRAATGLVWTVMIVLVGVALATPVLLIWGRVQRTRAEAYRARITRDRWSNPVDALAVLNKTPEALWREFIASAAFEAQVAPFKQYPTGLDALSISAPATKAAEPLALPAPASEMPSIIEVDKWLPWLTDEMYPHLLLIAKTRGGKSTLADIILKYRAARGDQIAILDPHWSTEDKHGNKKWGGIPPLAKSTDEIKAALRKLKNEYESRKRRMQLPANDSEFVPEMCFDPMTILIDEVPEIVGEFANNPTLKTLWGDTVRIFTSGGAKVNMYVILLSQSPNVEDVGMNAKMRDNLTSIAMANLVKPFIDNYERDDKRKRMLVELVNNNSSHTMKPAELPAVAEYGGEVHVLSRDGILAHRETSINADVWGGTMVSVRSDPDPLLEGLLATKAMDYAMVENPKNGQNGFSEHSIVHSEVDVEQLARELFAASLTQKEVGDRIRARGLKIDQREMPRLQREALGK